MMKLEEILSMPETCINSADISFTFHVKEPYRICSLLEICNRGFDRDDEEVWIVQGVCETILYFVAIISCKV